MTRCVDLRAKTFAISQALPDGTNLLSWQSNDGFVFNELFPDYYFVFVSFNPVFVCLDVACDVDATKKAQRRQGAGPFETAARKSSSLNSLTFIA